MRPKQKEIILSLKKRAGKMKTSNPKQMIMHSILLVESLKGNGSKTIFNLAENYINNTKRLLSDKQFSARFDKTEYPQLERILKDTDKFKDVANNLLQGKKQAKQDVQGFYNFLNLTSKMHEISYLRSLK